MAANAQIFSDSSDLRDCTQFNQAASISSDIWGYDASYHGNSCEYIHPLDESIISKIPIAVASSSEEEERIYAEKFIEFVLSPEAQGYWFANKQLPILKEGFDYPVEGIDRPKMDTSWETINSSKGINFNQSLANVIENSIIYYFQGAFTDTMEELYATWEDISIAYNNQEISEAEFRSLCREMSSPSISLDEALAISLEIQANISVTDSYIQQWKLDVISRYQSIPGMAELEIVDLNNDGSFFNEFAIGITSPINNSVVDGCININSTVVDYGDWSFLYGVTNVEFWLDNNLIATKNLVDSKSGGLYIFSIEWNTSDYSSGIHTLKVIAKEYNGRTTQQQIIVIIQDSSFNFEIEGIMILLGAYGVSGYISISKRTH